jgi:hypothetical protein
LKRRESSAMTEFNREPRNVLARALGWALALLACSAPLGAWAQPPGVPPSPTAEPGWYGYVPGRGWVSYAPASEPLPASNVTVAPPGSSSVPPGWAGYSPATAWTGYAPASAPVRPVVTPVYPPGPARRRAANLAVNRIAPQFAYAIPAYREYGSARSVPLAKPWLPPSP